MNYPDDMDQECIRLCDVLNALPGIETRSSCCGHGKRPHRVFFECDTIEHLRPVLENILSSAWRVEACYANGSNTIYLMLEGPVGLADIPEGANDLASWIEA